MGLLLNRMYEMKRKPQQYHPLSQKFFPHPAGPRFNRQVEIRRIREGNEYLIKKLQDRASIDGTYSIPKSEKSFQKHLYYRSLIMKSGANKKPYINFATPKDFERNFYSLMGSGDYNTNYRKRPISSFNNDIRSASAKHMNYSSTWTGKTYGTSTRPMSTMQKNKKKIEIDKEY